MKLQGQNRNQMQIISLESCVDVNSYARVIDAFVDFLSLEELGFSIKGKLHNGRPAYPAAALLKLYFYGYINRVRSSRRLQREAQTNIEAMWLLKGLHPCYKVIADFRKNNSKPFKEVFKSFNIFLRDEGLFFENVVATDGSKFRAQNSKKNNYNEKKIKGHLDYIEKQTQQYIKEMDELDKLEDADELHLEQSIDLNNKLNHLASRKKKYEVLNEKIHQAHEKGETQISTSDEDARALPKKMNIVEVGYNAVTTTEAKNKLITNFEILNTQDTYALANAALNARQALNKQPGEPIMQLADKGFDTGSELKTCIENDVLTFVAPKKRANTIKDKKFNKEAFIYDSDKDVYICPQNKVLKSNGKWYNKNKGKLRRSYKVKHYKLPFCSM